MSTQAERLAALPLAPQAARPSAASFSSVAIWLPCCLFMTLVCALRYEAMRHWFLLPVMCCGMLIGDDAVDWFRGRVGLFSPIGILGLLGLHFFYFAPLMHVALDFWVQYIVPPPDWREWVGAMAVINALGLAAYRLSRRQVLSRALARPPAATTWRLRRPWFFAAVAAAAVGCTLLQTYTYAKHGGIAGFIADYTQREGPMEDSGLLLVFSECFPIVAAMAFVVAASERRAWRSWLAIFAALGACFVLQLFFGGLRGSRSNTVWGLFWVVGIIHLCLRPLPKRFIYVGMALLLTFMYVYGLYKGAGEEVVDVFQGNKSALELGEEKGRTIENLVLADLGRCDVQAFLLYRLLHFDCDYGWGRSYAAAFTMFIPRALWRDRPPGKAKEGTEAQYGKGSYRRKTWQSSLVYGLAGEAMLNFTPISVPFFYVLLGALVAAVEAFTRRLPPLDSRRLLAPMLVNLCFVVLASDSDNILFFLLKNSSVPALIVVLCSVRLPLSAENPASSSRATAATL